MHLFIKETVTLSGDGTNAIGTKNTGRNKNIAFKTKLSRKLVFCSLKDL